MRKRYTVVVSGLGLLGCLVMLASASSVRAAQDKPIDSKTLLTDATAFELPQTRLFGKDDAKVKVIGFLDYECPACRAHFMDAEKAVRNNPNTAFYVTQFPLPSHKLARPAATLAIKAEEKGKFAEVNRALLEGNQLTKRLLRSVERKFRLSDKLTPTTSAQLEQLDREDRAIGAQFVPSFLVCDRDSAKIYSWRELVDKMAAPSDSGTGTK